MPPVGFEPTVSAGKRPQIHAVDRATTGTGFVLFNKEFCFDNCCQMTRKLVYVAVCEIARPRHLLVLRLTDGFVHCPYQMAQCYTYVSTRQSISRWMKGRIRIQYCKAQ